MKTKNSVTVGIDWSMSSPAITIHKGKVWHFSNCKFYYITDKKKCLFPSNQFIGYDKQPFDVHETSMERFDKLSCWAESIINKNALIAIEDYSMGSKGRVFHIAECAGILKYNLWKSGRAFHTIPPTVIKKYACGKGSADKIKMLESFVSQTGFDPLAIFDIKAGASPLADIVDSYFIAKYIHEHHFVQ